MGTSEAAEVIIRLWTATRFACMYFFFDTLK